VYCLAPFQELFIREYGTVTPCCFFKDPSIRYEKGHLKDVYFGEVYKSLRESILQKQVHPYCQGCPVVKSWEASEKAKNRKVQSEISLANVEIAAEKVIPRGNIIVSHRKKYIYFPIPRVASTSITMHIAKDMEIDTSGYGSPVMIRRKVLPSLRRTDIGNYTEYFKFAFVRNPWARVLSAYPNNLIKNLEEADASFIQNAVYRFFQTQYPGVLRVGMQFKDFLKAVVAIDDVKIDPHLASQYLFLVDEQQRLLPDFIGKLEDIGEDFKVVASKANFASEGLQHLNNKNRREYRKFYDQEARELVAQRYCRDIEMFKYEF
jgi:hypothetical protein